MIRVIVAEDDISQRLSLAKNLNQQEGISVVGVAEDGMETLRLVRECQPTVLVCDIVMPRMDGFAVMEQVRRIDSTRRPRIIALTALCRDDFISRAMSLGADYYMVKPVNIGFLTQEILTLGNRGKKELQLPPLSLGVAAPGTSGAPPAASRESRDSEALDVLVANTLLSLGMPAHLNGYRFIHQAVLMVLNKPDMLSNITCMLYPAVARMFSTTASRVERSIRHAIHVTWNHGGPEAFSKALETRAFTHADRPTNCEMIALLSEWIRYRLGSLR